MNTIRLLGFALFLLSGSFTAVSHAAGKEANPAPVVPSTAPLVPGMIPCGNLIYAGNRSSVCFADKFLTDAAGATTAKVEKHFRAVRLDADNLFDLPFCVFSGEEAFTLTERERKNLRHYLLNGGFLLSSPSCSNEAWDKSLRKEIELALPEYKLNKIPMTHPVFSVLNKIDTLKCKNRNTALLEGLEVNGRLVMIHSKEGLNDVGNAKGCCCCGGNEILQSASVNVNILTYVLLY
ncbi:MAG: DUF4159 domain-containing protein [Opitutaceae bacterium]|nr:DUF4159 domain-containing protein [Opitutaceae bacterium]